MEHYFNTNIDFNYNSSKKRGEIFEFQYELFDYNFRIESTKGIFSKDELDRGSKKLIENLINVEGKGLVIDYGCGLGNIGIANSVFTFNDTLFIDINFKAVRLSKENMDKNKFKIGIKKLKKKDKNIDQKEIFVVTNSLKFVNIVKIINKYDFFIIYLYPPEKSGKNNIKNILKEIKDFSDKVKRLDENKKIFIEIVINRKMKWVLNYLKSELKLDDVEKLDKGEYSVYLFKR